MGSESGDRYIEAAERVIERYSTAALLTVPGVVERVLDAASDEIHREVSRRTSDAEYVEYDPYDEYDAVEHQVLQSYTPSQILAIPGVVERVLADAQDEIRKELQCV